MTSPTERIFGAPKWFSLTVGFLLGVVLGTGIAGIAWIVVSILEDMK
jgi:hypothetical protein